jgi:DNA-binding CsgD family transcriptional regulator
VVAANRQRREGTFASGQLRLALDVIDEGVMFLDSEGRPLAMNRACERQLGCSIADLDGRPFWEQFDLRTWHGEPVMGTERVVADFRHLGRFGPVLVRLVNRQGLTTTGSLRVRRVSGDGASDGPTMVAVFNETPDVGAPELSPFGWMRQAHAVHALSQELGDAELSDQLLAERLAALDLTTRETEIVAMLLRGHRVSTIAQRLYLSPHTIRNHLKAVFRKLQVGSQVELVATVRARVRG